MDGRIVEAVIVILLYCSYIIIYAYYYYIERNLSCEATIDRGSCEHMNAVIMHAFCYAYSELLCIFCIAMHALYCYAYSRGT